MKSYKLTVRFDPSWILSKTGSGSGTLMSDIIDVLCAMYKSDKVLVVSREFHQGTVIILVEDEINSEAVRSKIKEIPCVDEDAVIDLDNVELTMQELSDIVKSIKDRVSSECMECLKNEFGIDVSTFTEKEKDIEITKKDNGANKEGDKISVDELVNNMIGMKPIKAWIEEVRRISEYVNSNKQSIGNPLSRFVYLMSINRGNGLSTALDVMGKTLQDSGLWDSKEAVRIHELVLPFMEEATEQDVSKGLNEFFGAVSGKKNIIISVNIEAWMDHLDDSRFRVFLDLIWSNLDDYMFVISIPYVDDEILEKVKVHIDDKVNVRVMRIAPLSDSEYFEYFTGYFKKRGMKVSDDAYSVFVSKLISEKNDGRFYGFNTVRKICDEVVYRLIVKAAYDNVEVSDTVTAAELNDIFDLDDSNGICGIDQLNALVSLNAVKQKIQEVLATVKLQKKLYQQGKEAIKPTFHMMFTGNPGTGKTVVARIVGRIFREEGLLSVGNFYEVSRKDFVGKFVGHTSPKTMELCRNAYGSVLFIDEAYTLANKGDGYSQEAIGTLIAEMENNRDNMVVIFAGYEKELEALFDLNPGLRDRIPHKVNFPNYTKQELKEIFFLQLSKKIEFSPEFEARANEFFDNFPSEIMASRDFSNGRFVRNLAERIMTKAAMRLEFSESESAEVVLSPGDFDMAISDSDYSVLFAKKSNKTKIGF